MTPSIADQELNDVATVDSEIRSGSGPYVPQDETPTETTPTTLDAPASATTETATETVSVQPVVETPAVDPVKLEVKDSATPTDISKILEEATGGKIKSAEELSRILEENTTLSEKLRSSPELSDYTLKLDAWVKNGYEPELFHLISDLPLDEMSAPDQVRAYLKVQNPEWSSEDIDVYVKHTYNQLSDDEEGYNATAVKVGGLKLQQDSYNMASELRKLQEATTFTTPDNKEAIDIEASRQTSWKANLPSIGASFTKIPFQLDEKNTFNFVPSQAQIQNAIKSVEQAVLNAPVSYDDNGIGSVKELIKNTLINQNINDLIKAATKQASSMVLEQKIKESHNPSGAPNLAPGPIIEKSLEDVNAEKVDAFFNS